MKAFKPYDIRGKYVIDLDEDLAYKVGFHLPRLLNSQKVLVGYDCRLSSPSLFKALCDGITDSGSDVYNAGYCTTPMVYYLCARHGFDASVQITASHNSKEYNGFKISRQLAMPVGEDSGLKELEELVLNSPTQASENKGKLIDYGGYRDEYIAFLKGFTEDFSNLNISIDCSNGMSALIAKDVLGGKHSYINDYLDGSFPAHEPNPLEEENTEQLKQLVLKNKSDIGVIFDGDADRVVFIDQNGRFVSPDLIIAILAQHYLKHEKGIILHDIRTSKAVSEYIERLGGSYYMWKVGHAFAKDKMRELGAIAGGELAGHYYFRDFFNCDSALLATIIVLNSLSEAKKQGLQFSDIINKISKYYYSGEINFKITDKAAATEAVISHFKMQQPIKSFDFDGYRLEYSDWWFNLRVSNTENYLRLVAEANTKELLDIKLSEIKNILKAYQ